MLLSRSGPINTWYKMLTGGTENLINVYSMSGMMLIEALLWSPLVFLLLGGTLRNFNPELEEAANMSGAGTWATIKRITLRLSMPSILALMMLVFIRTVEAFEVPALVGTPGPRACADDRYLRSHAPLECRRNSARRARFRWCCSSSCRSLLYFYGRMTRNAEKFATITGKSFRPREFELGVWRMPAGCALLLYFFVMIIMPLSVLVWTSLHALRRRSARTAFKLMSFKNYGDHLLRLAQLSISSSIRSSSRSARATFIMLLAAVTAWLSVRKAPGARTLDQLATTPLVFPGIVLGVGVMQFFLNVPLGLYGTIWIIVWAFVINYLPYGVRYSVRRHAAGPSRTRGKRGGLAAPRQVTALRRIVIPLLAPSSLPGWLFIFLLSTRVLSLPVLLSGPSSQTMAVAMFDLWGNGQGPELAALGLVWSLMMTVDRARSSISWPAAPAPACTAAPEAGDKMKCRQEFIAQTWPGKSRCVCSTRAMSSSSAQATSPAIGRNAPRAICASMASKARSIRSIQLATKSGARNAIATSPILPEKPDHHARRRARQIRRRHRCAMAQGRVRAAPTFSAPGFDEVPGEEGAALGRELASVIEETGLAVCGPNCMGNFNSASHFFTLTDDRPHNFVEGPVALFGQSGGIVMAIKRGLEERGLVASAFRHQRQRDRTEQRRLHRLFRTAAAHQGARLLSRIHSQATGLPRSLPARARRRQERRRHEARRIRAKAVRPQPRIRARWRDRSMLSTPWRARRARLRVRNLDDLVETVEYLAHAPLAAGRSHQRHDIFGRLSRTAARLRRTQWPHVSCAERSDARQARRRSLASAPFSAIRSMRASRRCPAPRPISNACKR